MGSGSVGAVLVAVSVLVVSIGAFVAIIWISRKAKPLGNLPYRWGFYLGLSNGIGGFIYLYLALSAFGKGAVSEGVGLLILVILAEVAAVGTCRRRRWGAVVLIASQAVIGGLPPLKALAKTPSTVNETANAAQKGQIFAALLFLIVNVVYFKKRWKLMGPNAIPVIGEPIVETASSNNPTPKGHQFNGSLAGRRLRTFDDALQVYQSRDFNSPVVAPLAAGADIQLGAASELEGREWLEAKLLDGTTGYVLGPSARSHTEASDL